MAQNIGPVLILNIDATGTSEARPLVFSFANDPLIRAGDSLSSATPSIGGNEKTPAGQTPLTYGVASLSGNTWTCEVSVSGGNPNNAYTTCCRATTTAGYTVEAFVPVVLEGVGYQPPASPIPGPAVQTPATVYAGPASSPNASPAFRALVATDLPTSGVASGTYPSDTSHVPNVTLDQFGRATNATSSIYQVERFATASLPTPGSTGRQVLTTDNNQSVAHDNGNFWVLGGLGQYDLQDFATDNLLGSGGSHDDVPAFQAAWNAAAPFSGTVVVPPPKVGYVWNSGLSLQGSGNTSRAVNWKGSTSNSNHGQIITYNGGSNTSAVTLLGVMDCTFEHMGIVPAPGLSNVVIWDYQFSSALGSTGTFNRHFKCNTVFNNNPNCIWMRLGQSTGGASSGFNIVLDHCLVNDVTQNSGTIACQIGGSQNYATVFRQCTFLCSCNICCGPIVNELTSGISNGATTIPIADTLLFPTSGSISIAGQTATYTSKSVAFGAGNLVLSSPWAGGTIGNGVSVNYFLPSQGVYSGNCSFLFDGGSMQGNSMGYDVLINASGFGVIKSMECQNNSSLPRRFLQVGVGGSSAIMQLKMSEVTLKNYQPPTDGGGVIQTHFNTILELDKCLALTGNTTPYSSTSNAWFLNNSGASGLGRIKFKDCAIFGTFPFANAGVGTHGIIKYEHVVLIDHNGTPQSVLSEEPYAYVAVTAATYSALTSDHTIACNATSNAITVNLPAANSVPPGYEYTIKKTDSSGNAVTVTAAGSDKIDGAATYVLSAQYSTATIRSDSSANWLILSKI